MINWDLVDESWDTIGTWDKFGEGISEIDPPGQLYQKPTSDFVMRQKILAGGLPTQYTFETRLKLETIYPFHSYSFYDGEHVITIRIYPNSIACSNEGGGYNFIYLTNDIDVFYIWRLVLNSSGHSIKVWRNYIYIGEFTSLRDYVSEDGKIYTMTVLVNNYDHEDYFRLASGLYEVYPIKKIKIYKDLRNIIINPETIKVDLYNII